MTTRKPQPTQDITETPEEETAPEPKVTDVKESSGPTSTNTSVAKPKVSSVPKGSIPPEPARKSSNISRLRRN